MSLWRSLALLRHRWAGLFLMALLMVSLFAELLVGSAPVAVGLDGRILVLPSVTAPALWHEIEATQRAFDWVIWPLVHTRSTFDTAIEGWRALLQWWLHATRFALVATATITLIASCAGAAGGWLAASSPRLADPLLRRAMEVTGALPSLVLVAVLRVSHALPAGLDLVVVLIVLRSVEATHLVRSLLVPAGEQDFVVAARAVGGSPLHILRWHLFPHLARPLAALAATTLAALISLEAALTLMGLGLPAGSSSWGAMLVSDANDQLAGALPFALLSMLMTALALSVLARQVQRDRWVQRHHL
jgi:ABC-type dipeptide/oligopeptide/nickel transport system permease subunit